MRLQFSLVGAAALAAVAATVGFNFVQHDLRIMLEHGDVFPNEALVASIAAVTLAGAAGAAAGGSVGSLAGWGVGAMRRNSRG